MQAGKLPMAKINEGDDDYESDQVGDNKENRKRC